MAFCKYCGRKLADNEVCTCPDAVRAAAAEAQSSAREIAAGAAQTADNAQNYASQATEGVQNYAAQTVDYAQNYAVQATDNAQNYASQTMDYAQNYALQTAGNMQNYAGQAGVPTQASSGGFMGFVKKYLLFICIGGGVLVAGIVLLLIFTLGGSGGGYKAPVENLVKEINKAESADYMSLYDVSYPSELKKLYQSFYALLESENPLESNRERVQEYFADLKDEYSDWKLKFEYADEIDPMSKTELNTVKKSLTNKENLNYYIERIEDREDDIVDDFVDYYDANEKDVRNYLKSVKEYLKNMKEAEVTEGYLVKGRYIITSGGEEINKTDTVTMYVIKLNGEWVLYGVKKGSPYFKEGSKYDSYKYVKFLHDFISGNNFYVNNTIPPYSY